MDSPESQDEIKKVGEGSVPQDTAEDKTQPVQGGGDPFAEDTPLGSVAEETAIPASAEEQSLASDEAPPLPHLDEAELEQKEKEDDDVALPLGERLVVKGLISADQLEVALKEQRDQEGKRRMLGSILVDLGFITESALGEALTESTGAVNFSLKTAALDPKLIRQVPKDTALRAKAIPVSITDDEVQVALSDVYNIVAIDQIKAHFPRDAKIVPVYSPETEILEVIDQYYDYEMSVDGILKEIETGISENGVLSGEEEGYVNPTVRLVDAILIDAIKIGASDIHFEPEDAFLRLRYRIDGKMIQIRTFHKNYWQAIAVRIKIISSMNIAETRKPQDGRIAYNVLGRDIDFRVATQPTVHGENVVMRILDKKKSLLPLSQLGFTEHSSKLLKKCLKRPEGIIIITGPTGSGKTTTLYSVLNYINSVDVNIMTLEDPVEYQMPLIRQSNIAESAGMGFTEGIKSLMRQDPDIIFVGEVRDNETANMAVRAAMTGHQVYTTLHTNDALGAVPRLVDIGVPPHLLAGSLICVIAQRLARRLCECKEEVVATEEECKILLVDPKDAPKIFKHKGCDKCMHTGYKGRITINEVLQVDKGLDELIATSSTRTALIEHARSNGFVPMTDDGAMKVLDGVTDLDELIRTIDMTERL